MKPVITIVLSLAVLVGFRIPKLKNKKSLIIALYAICMIALFSVYNIRTLGRLIPFYQPINQTMYQPEFLENGEYPDAFLDLYLKGKTVYTANDKADLSELSKDTEHSFIQKSDDWIKLYYHGTNIWNYLRFVEAKVVKDDSLNDITLSEKQLSHFEELGYANDMMRYTFPLNDYMEEWGNGFYYYWYYCTHIKDIHVYMCADGMKDSDEVVFIWQYRDDTHDGENFYIASKKYYDEVIANE